MLLILHWERVLGERIDLARADVLDSVVAVSSLFQRGRVVVSLFHFGEGALIDRLDELVLDRHIRVLV